MGHCYASPRLCARADDVELNVLGCRVDILGTNCDQYVYKHGLMLLYVLVVIVQELCESRGGRPGLSVLTSLLVSVDVKNY